MLRNHHYRQHRAVNLEPLPKRILTIDLPQPDSVYERTPSRAHSYFSFYKPTDRLFCISWQCTGILQPARQVRRSASRHIPKDAPELRGMSIRRTALFFFVLFLLSIAHRHEEPLPQMPAGGLQHAVMQKTSFRTSHDRGLHASLARSHLQSMGANPHFCNYDVSPCT